jgi:hypothetical protein
MNITVEILGRATMDAPFAQLAAPAVLAVPGVSLGYTPVLPAAAAVMDLLLKVTASGTATVDVGQWLDAALRPPPADLFDKDGNVVGQTPAPAPAVYKSYCAWGGLARDVPFSAGNSFLFRRSGAAA